MLPDDHLTSHKIPKEEESNMLWGESRDASLISPSPPSFLF